MVDLHCHVLPGLDDGAPSMDESIAMAQVAAADGFDTIVATPHIRDDHPFGLRRIAELVSETNVRLEDEDVAVRVVGGGEVALTKIAELDDEALASVCLGDGRYLLVESPYTHATDLLEGDIFAAQVRGFRPVLAHPERSPSFLSNPSRLAALVDRGVLCSITAASMAGAFGKTVQRFAAQMISDGLVHNVASDAHGPTGRKPVVRSGFQALDNELPGIANQSSWYSDASPRAMIAGEDLPPRPDPPARARKLRQLLRRG